LVPHLAIPTIFMPDALPRTTLPIYPGLGQAPNMLACIPGSLVLSQWFIKCSYGLCSSLNETGGGKESFWNKVFHLISCIPQNEMTVLAVDMYGHVGISNVGYDGMHGGFGYEDRNSDGTRILEFADGLNLVICSTLFMKQESQLVTYADGPVESTVDYITVRQEDKA